MNSSFGAVEEAGEHMFGDGGIVGSLGIAHEIDSDRIADAELYTAQDRRFAPIGPAPTGRGTRTGRATVGVRKARYL
jgi:hypothetical protein